MGFTQNYVLERKENVNWITGKYYKVVIGSAEIVHIQIGDILIITTYAKCQITNLYLWLIRDTKTFDQ